MKAAQFQQIEKCPFFDSGYCKYRDKCHLKHFPTKCENSVCGNKNCSFRHPKQCKYSKRCNHNSKGVCAYDHADITPNLEKDEYSPDVKLLKNRLKQLEDNINKNERDHANQIEIL